MMAILRWAQARLLRFFFARYCALDAAGVNRDAELGFDLLGQGSCVHRSVVFPVLVDEGHQLGIEFVWTLRAALLGEQAG